MSKVRWLLLLVTVSFDFRYAEATTAGVMTMWSLNSEVITGSIIAQEGGPSACNFADPKDGGLDSPAAKSPYIRTRQYCAADVNTLFAGGQACGKCYQISYTGYAGGRAGSTVIQVVNSGHMEWGAVFDCQIEAFQRITGSHSGVYKIDYEETSCDTSDGGGTATMLSDAYAYPKFVFSNLVHPPTSVTVVADRVEYPLEMEPCCGTWSGRVGEQHESVGFKLILSDGSSKSFRNCFEGYSTQVRGASCQEFVELSHQKCANSWGEGRDACRTSGYAVCVGHKPDGIWGECQQTLEDPSNRNCDGNFGSDTDHACRDPRYRACIGHQAGKTWGNCLELLPFDPSGQNCSNDGAIPEHGCRNPEYPMCVGFEEGVSWGKCRQPHADASVGGCAGDSDCKNSPYTKCVGSRPGGARWGSCVVGASAVLPSGVLGPFGSLHQSHMMALVSCTSLAFIIAGLAARWMSRRATSHLPESSGLMVNE